MRQNSIFRSGSDDRKLAAQVSQVVELLSRKWTVHILFAMSGRAVRLSALKRQVPAASKKALTSSLRALEAEGLIVRRDLSSSVLHVEYESPRQSENLFLNYLDVLQIGGSPRLPSRL